MRKKISFFLAFVMLLGVIGPIGAVYAETNKHMDVQESILVEELKFYFEEVGYFNEQSEYVVTNPELLKDRIENGDEVAKDLYELYMGNEGIQTFGVVDYGKCILRDYFGVYIDLINGNLFDSFVGYVQDKAWTAAAKILIKVTGALGTDANIIATAGQIAVAAYNCRREL